jgi:hypothetical protein
MDKVFSEAYHSTILVHNCKSLDSMGYLFVFHFIALVATKTVDDAVDLYSYLMGALAISFCFYVFDERVMVSLPHILV